MVVVRRLVIVALFSFGCGGSDPQGGGPRDAAIPCPNDLPPACPSPAPSYAADIAPLIMRRCTPCHYPGGVAAMGNHDLSDYPRVFAQKRDVLTQFYACKMPPADAGAPTADERKAMLGWLVCGAPE